VECGLADVDANRGYDAVLSLPIHGACSSKLLATAICGQEHGRSIPLADELLARHLLYSDGINPYWVGILVFMIGVFTPVT
jgi:hypothetical protein